MATSSSRLQPLQVSCRSTSRPDSTPLETNALCVKKLQFSPNSTMLSILISKSLPSLLLLCFGFSNFATPSSALPCIQYLLFLLSAVSRCSVLEKLLVFNTPAISLRACQETLSFPAGLGSGSLTFLCRVAVSAHPLTGRISAAVNCVNGQTMAGSPPLSVTLA